MFSTYDQLSYDIWLLWLLATVLARCFSQSLNNSHDDIGQWFHMERPIVLALLPTSTYNVVNPRSSKITIFMGGIDMYKPYTSIWQPNFGLQHAGLQTIKPPKTSLHARTAPNLGTAQCGLYGGISEFIDLPWQMTFFRSCKIGWIQWIQSLASSEMPKILSMLAHENYHRPSLLTVYP